MNRTLRQMVADIDLEVGEMERWSKVAKDLRLFGLDNSAAVVARDRAGRRARQAILQAADELRRVPDAS